MSAADVKAVIIRILCSFNFNAGKINKNMQIINTGDEIITPVKNESLILVRKPS